MRSGKYTRKKINGEDVKLDESEHIVIENHHQAIIKYQEFATVKALMESRSTNNYRGQKKYDNVYSGFLVCGDCGSPMFAMSRSDLKDAYRCGLYHRRGLKACTSHHIRVEKLDEMIKHYVQIVKNNSEQMLAQLNANISEEEEDVQETERSAANLEEVLSDLQEELKATKRQRIRDIVKHPDQEKLLEETYDELEEDLAHRIAGLQNQIELTLDKRNTIIRINRVAQTALDAFEDILTKDKLEKNDLLLIIEKIKVYEAGIDIQLKPDIDGLLRCGTLPDASGEEPEDETDAETSEKSAETFNFGTKDSLNVTIVQETEKRPDKVFRANVIYDGDPLEIFTDKDGELIFKKYSPIGELSDFAAQICDSLRKATDGIAVVCDRDAVIAVAGGAKRELLEKPLSPQLHEIMENRRVYRHQSGGSSLPVTSEDESYCLSVAAPVLAEGDVLGCVLFVTPRGSVPGTEVEYKLAQTVALFLGKQMES